LLLTISRGSAARVPARMASMIARALEPPPDARKPSLSDPEIKPFRL
jgi:hypothetical protein